MAKLILKNIEKVYSNGTKAVENISFEVNDGDFLVLVGPSGCGKTTILRIIAGLEDLTCGEIYLDERKLNDLHPKDRDIGMVFQNYALYPHLTVYDNLAFPLQIKKLKKNEINNDVHKIAKLLHIEHLLTKKPKELSGGERQRVALGRALIRKPKILLFDEPLSNLDAKLRVEMRTEILSLHKSFNAISIYVTHDQIEAMTMATKIIVLNKGKIQQIGTPSEIYNQPMNTFVASFIGSTPINFFKCKLLEQNETQTKIQIGENKKFLISKKLYLPDTFTLAIRPENIKPVLSQKVCDNALKCKIINIENLGYEKNVYFEFEKQIKVCKTNANFDFTSNDEFFFLLDVEKFLYFDEYGQLINNIYG